MTVTDTPSSLLDRITTMLSDTRTSRHHGHAVEALYQDVFQVIGTLKEQLSKLESYVVIDSDGDLRTQLRAAQSFWQIQPGGPDPFDVKDLVAISPTLTALSRAGCEFLTARRSSEKTIGLACDIAEAFRDCSHYLRSFNDSRFKDLTVSGQHLAPIVNWLRKLAAEGLATGFKTTATFKGTNGTWRRNITSHGNAHGALCGQIAKGELHGDLPNLIRGPWLELHGDWILTDQLRRTGTPHEAYTNLTYSLPRDLGGGSSEIDLLIRTEQVLTIIECKSGRAIKRNGNLADTFVHALRSFERLEGVIETMGVELERRYALLCIPQANETREDLQKLFNAATSLEVDLLTPADLRSSVQTIAA